MRSRKAKSRHHRLTETEIALQWELRRTRAELAALRKAHAEGPRRDDGPVKLYGVARARFFQKLDLFWRRTLMKEVPLEARCPSCGGISFDQCEMITAQMVARLEAEEAEKSGRGQTL